MDFKDYYEILGVKKDASKDEIKRSYKKLARKYHPDVSKEADAEVRFKVLNEAYQVLKDPEKRAAYDQLGSNYQAGQDFNPPPNWDAGFEFNGGDAAGAGNADYSEFFESIFGHGFGSARGGHQQRGYNARGEDHHAKVLIDLEDAYLGATRSVTLQSPEIDSSGHVVNKRRTLKVKIPKGVKQGQHIRLTGQGSPGMGGEPAGDLYLIIEFNPHTVYRVDGSDVYLDLPLAPWEAALGASVKVPTPLGPVDLKIAAGTPANRKLRLKGRGIPSKVAGDLYVITQLSIPPADSDAAKALYKKMQEELAYNPRSTLGV